MRSTLRSPTPDPGAYWRDRYTELAATHEQTKRRYDMLRGRWTQAVNWERETAGYAQMVCRAIVEDAQR